MALPEVVPPQWRFAGQPWAPTQFPAPLADAYVSDGPRFIRMLQKRWRMEDGSLIRLDDWQSATICALLERFPDDHPTEHLRGRLRWRQALVSMGRQNGKSILGGVLALYGLTHHSKAPSVIGVASSLDQANIIFKRTAQAVKTDQGLNRMLKATGTRGVRKRDGSGDYQVKPSLDEGLQGVPITLGIADELHLSKESMWDSLVVGQRAQTDGLLIGLTTAGDSNSLLLKRLYADGDRALAEADPDGRFGFFLWTAPPGSTIDTPGAIEAANPAVACGRLDVHIVRSDVRNQPVQDQDRYTLNRQIEAVSTWLPLAAWQACAKGGLPPGRVRGLVWTIAKTGSWEHASITATAKVDGLLRTELVASIANPSLEQLERICGGLYAQHGGRFALSSRSLGSLGNSLRDRGYEVYKLVDTEVQEACSMAFAKIATGSMSHPDDDLLRFQMPLAKRKNVGDSWTLAPSDNPLGIDSILGMVMGLHVAETHPPPAPMI